MGPGILPETTVGKHNPPCHLQMPTKALLCKKEAICEHGPEVGVARYMYSYRTVTVQASRFGAWCLTTNTGNSPPIQKGAPAAMQRCLITTSRRTANANGDTEAGALMFGSLYFILIMYQLAVKLAMLELMCVCARVRVCVRVCACVCVCVTRSLQLFPYTSRINFKHLLSY